MRTAPSPAPGPPPPALLPPQPHIPTSSWGSANLGIFSHVTAVKSPCRVSAGPDFHKDPKSRWGGPLQVPALPPGVTHRVSITDSLYHPSRFVSSQKVSQVLVRSSDLAPGATCTPSYQPRKSRAARAPRLQWGAGGAGGPRRPRGPAAPRPRPSASPPRGCSGSPVCMGIPVLSASPPMACRDRGVGCDTEPTRSHGLHEAISPLTSNASPGL